MTKFEEIWREQCEAAVTMQSRYGERAALDYIVAGKLLQFTSAARARTEFAEQLPLFVARVRQMFPREAIAAHIDELERRLVAKSHQIESQNVSLDSIAVSDLTSLRQIRALLRAGKLGRT